MRSVSAAFIPPLYARGQRGDCRVVSFGVIRLRAGCARALRTRRRALDSEDSARSRPVFAALRDPKAFAQVRCERGYVEWPGDLDLAPDAMYAEIRKSGRWVLE
jgi:hypothetical protein